MALEFYWISREEHRVNKVDANSVDSGTRLLCDMTGRKQVVLAGRASAALGAALRARGLEGQWILMPANMCYIVGWAILQSGNLPYLVDIDPATGNISLETLSRVEIEAPAALIICHMYGLGAPIAELAAWAKQRGIMVIEDATLALGATVDGRPAGSWGDISLFSFGEGKIVDIGLGGALLTDDTDLAHRVSRALEGLPPWSSALKTLQDQWTELYWLLHQYEEINTQLPEIYPTLYRIYGGITSYRLPPSLWERLTNALVSLESNLNHRRAIASLYDELFQSMPVRTLHRPDGHVLWRYPLLISAEKRNALLEMLWENGILASRWYPSLSIMLAALSPAIEKRAMPGADQLAAEIINLPVDGTVDEELAGRTAGLIRTFLNQRRRFRWHRSE